MDNEKVAKFIKYKGKVYRQQEGAFTARLSDIVNIDKALNQAEERGAVKALHQTTWPDKRYSEGVKWGLLKAAEIADGHEENKDHDGKHMEMFCGEIIAEAIRKEANGQG